MNLSVHEGVAEIVLSNGENRHNPQFLAEILGLLDAIEADPLVQSLILSSNDPKYWSLGMDLNWLMAAVIDEAKKPEVRAFLHDMNRLYWRILSYPMPVLAAMGGHAFGNGAILASACDFRFMLASRGYFCFPEVDVNIPLLPGMYAVVKKAVPPYLLNELSISGRRVGGKEALEAHLAQGIFESPQELAEGVRAYAQSFKKSRDVVREQKRRNYQWIRDIIDRDDPPLIESLKLVV